MSLSIEPKKGVRLKLANYSVIKTWQGGGKFWEHDFQLTIRQGTLQEFLPRATEDGDSVFYEHFVDGNEAASASTQVSSLDQVPGAQIERLRGALAELKAKADDPHCDNNKKRMIEAFRLPDPQKDAELYRLYGSGSNRRLIVLWGVEKEVGSALAPLKALERVPQKTGGAGGGGKIWLWLLILLLLLIGAWFLFHKPHDIADAPDTPKPDGAPMTAGATPKPTGAPLPGGATPKPDGAPMTAGATPKPTGTPLPGGATPKPDGAPMTGGATPKPDGAPMTAGATPKPDGILMPVATVTASSLEITSTPSSNAPKDGQVEVLLKALARGSGALGEAPTITEWSVDGKVLRGKDEKPLTGASLPIQLTKGAHRVMVTGVGKDGGPIRSESEIEVGVITPVGR